MNIFKSAQNYYAAYVTDKRELLYSDASNPNLKVAPHVAAILRSYNRDAVRLLNQKRYGICGATGKGFVWYRCATLDIGMLKSREVLGRLNERMEFCRLTMQREQKRIREERMECQKYEKAHLVQQCNNMEAELHNKYVKDMLKLNQASLKVVNRQIQSVTEAEKLLAVRLEVCMDQIMEFYAQLSQRGDRGWLCVPTVAELQTIVPLQEFPEDYRKYRDELKELWDEYQNAVKTLRAQLGI